MTAASRLIMGIAALIVLIVLFAGGRQLWRNYRIAHYPITVHLVHPDGSVTTQECQGVEQAMDMVFGPKQ
jgi:hypothetical protein